MKANRHISMASTVPPIEFVSTSVSTRILDLISLASQLEDNAAIYGVPGIGKTFVLKHYFNGSGSDPFRMFTLDRASGLNSTYVINQLCESYGLQAAQSRATSLDRFRRHAEDYFYGDRQIIVFDEAQNLKIETLKDFANLNHDHALNITFVFCGNAELLKTVNSAKAEFYSLTRRIKQRTTVNTIEDADADAIAKAWVRFGQDVAAAGKANPADADAAEEILKRSKARIDGASAIAEEEKNLRLYTGTATKADLASRGLASSTNVNAGAFDRLANSMDRQSQAQLAEAATAGLGAAATAKLRAEFVLTEAANQSGAGAAAKYADQIKAIADRAGEAAQKLALAKLQSETAFSRDQLGRNATDATVADQLRGAFGNNADLNGAAASAIRLNENLKELKSTTLDLSSGAFRDFRTEIQSGTNALDAMGKVGVNALNKILDKMADKAFDNFISGTFGSLVGGGGGGLLSSLLGGGSGAAAQAASATTLANNTGGAFFGPGFAQGGTLAGGWGVVGEEGAELINVHTGGVTVYPHELSKPYLPGFAEGGSLSTWGNVSRLAAPAQVGGPQSGGQQQVNVKVEVSVNDKGELKAIVKNATIETIQDYAGSPAHLAHTADAVKQARTSRML